MKRIEIIVPDSGPLITLALAGALETLLLPKVPVHIPDMVRFEVIRDLTTPGASEIAQWIRDNERRGVQIRSTQTYEEYEALIRLNPTVRSRNRGEMAAAELLDQTVVDPDHYAVLLFEDSAVSRQNYLLRIPENVLILSTSAYLDGLQEMGMIPSAESILEMAVKARGEGILTREARSSSGESAPRWAGHFKFGK